MAPSLGACEMITRWESRKQLFLQPKMMFIFQTLLKSLLFHLVRDWMVYPLQAYKTCDQMQPVMRGQEETLLCFKESQPKQIGSHGSSFIPTFLKVFENSCWRLMFVLCFVFFLSPVRSGHHYRSPCWLAASLSPCSRQIPELGGRAALILGDIEVLSHWRSPWQQPADSPPSPLLSPIIACAACQPFITLYCSASVMTLWN